MTGWPGISPRPEELHAETPRGPRAALVIATATYQDPELRELRSPAQDATELAQVLGNPQVGAFAVTRVLDQEEWQVRRQIDAFLSGRGAGDLVLVYLSCHGVLDRRGRLFFAASDTLKARLGSTGIPAGWVLDQLDECRARRQVVILDCCFSGAFAHGSKGDGDLDLERRLTGQGRGRAVLTASRAGEYSFEGQAVPGAALATSVFTAGLVEGLRTGAADVGGDGYVSLDEAYDYAFSYVQSHGSRQTPQRWLYGGEGMIVLARSPAGVAVAPLPEALASGLDSPYPAVRTGAVEALAEWLSTAGPAGVLAARQKLQQIADTDIPAVAAAARSCLSRQELRPEAESAGPARVVSTLTQGSRWLTVHEVAFSSHGRLLASGRQDSKIQLWDVAAGQQLRTLMPAPEDWDEMIGPTYAVAFSPDGRLLASAGGDRTVRLWDPATGEELRVLSGHARGIWGVAFSPDGRLLASASEDRTVRMWDCATGASLRTLTGHAGPVNALAFSPDGRLLASASDDRTVHLWNPADGHDQRILTGHAGWVRSVAFSPDGRFLASAGQDEMVHLRDPGTGEHVRTLAGQGGPIRSVAFSPDSRLLASAGDDGTVRLWR